MVIPHLLGALVAQDKAEVGGVRLRRCDAGVHPHIIVHGNIAVAAGGHIHIVLENNRVPKALLQLAVIVVLLDQQLVTIHHINPVQALVLAHGVNGIILAFAAERVRYYGALHIRTAKQTNFLGQGRRHPIGVTALVNLKIGGIQQLGRVLEPQVTNQLLVKILRRGILDTAAEFFHAVDHSNLLAHHINQNIRGQAVFGIVDPLEYIRILQACYTAGHAPVVDLRGGVRNHILALVLRQRAQLLVRQGLGPRGVDPGHLIIANVGEIPVKVAVLHRH